MKRYCLCPQTFLPKGPSIPLVLDVLREVTVDQFTPQELKDTHFIRKWFQNNLKPFLPHASGEFLSCLSTKNFSCETYQTLWVWLHWVLSAFSIHMLILSTCTLYLVFIPIYLCGVAALGHQPAPDRPKLQMIYSNFIAPYLRRNDTEGACPFCSKKDQLNKLHIL